jgi:predicted DNA-binding protein (UPF0251 family)
MHKPKNVLERLHNKIDRRGPDDCWPWKARANNRGYGVLRAGSRTDGSRRQVYAHRVVLEEQLGRTLLPGMCALHTCDSGHLGCCNPLHLFEGTKGNNNRDRSAKGRNATGDRNGSRTQPERLLRGENHPSAKLRIDDVLAIRAEYASKNTSQEQLARRYNVDQATISSILKRRTWKHVNGQGHTP